MSKLFIPLPSMENLISYFVDWIAKNMMARVTINVYWHDGKHFTEEVDGRDQRMNSAKSELAVLRKDAYSLHNEEHIPTNAGYWKREAARIAKERDAMRSVLEVSRGNVLSIKNAVGIGVITYDIWLREINTVLGIEESNGKLELEKLCTTIYQNQNALHAEQRIVKLLIDSTSLGGDALLAGMN